jgi:enterobactin synthetase component F
MPIVLLDDALTWKAAPLQGGPALDDAAYVIYTSGSTGVPKGVVNDHRGIVNRLEWMRIHYGIDSSDRILQKTPATFDVSVWEFFLPLISGATLVIAPPEAHKDPAWLASIFRKERITTTHFVPSMLDAFLAEPSAQGLELRRVFCSGEELPVRLRDRFHEVIRAELHNLYGPTEAAVDVTYWPASAEDKSAPVPIGFPVWNTSMHVLDSHMRPLPPNVTGDLYIGGIQVARGYLGQPDLTAERFIPDPFTPGGRLYRTGDLAYRRRDGAIVFAGRSDFQVKIRGLRVELGEIETAILSSGHVSQAVVIAREDRPGDQRLAAYLVPREPGMKPDIDSLRGHLATLMPDYMVPSSFQVLDALPLSPNGKLDRSALPAPNFQSTAVSRPPKTETEKWLAQTFSEVLGLESVGADDDFFNLGGHSLLAARVMARVRERWKCQLGLGVMFANPTVARLAICLDDLDNQRPSDEGLGAVTPLINVAETNLPALFCPHPAGGVSWCYATLARLLNPVRPVYGLQARGLRGESIPESMEEMAADYVEEMRRIQPEGPYHLLGWSVGGIVAQAMAVRAQELGLQVGIVAMLDAYPSDCWRAEPPPDEAALLKALLHIAGHDPSTTTVAMNREAVIQFLRLTGHPLGSLSDEVLAAVMRVVESNNRLVRAHYHRPFRGTVLHFRAALDHQGRNLHASQWAPYVDGELVEIPVKSLHAHMCTLEISRHVADVLNARF